MANVTGASLQPIYNRLNSALRYHPLEANTFADPSLEAGDVVTVVRNGVNYSSPVHKAKVTWRKDTQVQISAGGNEERPSIPKMSGKKYGGGRSGLRNSEYLHYYVEDQYQQMRAGLELTLSSARLYIEDKYTQMQSGLALSTSSAMLYVDNKYTQMQSGLALSTSTAKLYVENKYTEMQSGLALSTSTAKLYVENKYTEMQSGLALSTSTAKLYVENKYTEMQSGLALSTSTAKLYVDNKYTQMQSGLALTSSSAALYTDNHSTRAYILTRINASGEGETLIAADKVSITGTTTVNGSLEIDDGNLVVKKSAVFRGNINLTTANSYVQAPIFSVTSGGHIRLIGTQSGEYYDITATNIKGAIKSASVANNVLTLTKWDGGTVTFSKATTQSSSWSGSVLTVTAKQVNDSTTTNVSSFTLGIGGNYGDHDVDLVVAQNGSPTVYSSTQITVPFYIGSQNGGGANPTSRYTTTLRYTVSSILQEKTVSSNGAVYPDSGYIGLSKVTVSTTAGGVSGMDFEASSPMSSRFFVNAYGSDGSSTYRTVCLTLENGQFSARQSTNSGTIYGYLPMPSLGNVYASTSTASSYDSQVTISSSIKHIYFTLGGKTYRILISHV